MTSAGMRRRGTGVYAPGLEGARRGLGVGEIHVWPHAGHVHDAAVEPREVPVVVFWVEAQHLARDGHVLVAQLEALAEGLEDGRVLRDDDAVFLNAISL